MIETVVASYDLGTPSVGVAEDARLGTVNIAGALTEEQSQGENIARNQTEAIFDCAYRVPVPDPRIPPSLLSKTTR